MRIEDRQNEENEFTNQTVVVLSVAETDDYYYRGQKAIIESRAQAMGHPDDPVQVLTEAGHPVAWFPHGTRPRGEIFSVEKAHDKSRFDFEIFVIGEFDEALPAWFGRAVEVVWSWWDGQTGIDAGNQVGYRLRSDMSVEQRASVTRLLRRAARISKRGMMPELDAACLARCERAFAA